MRQEPRNARLLNDLAVAYLARAGNSARPEDLVRALAAACRAVQADRRLPEARFNRALALEKLFLSNAAVQAWREVALREQGNGWAREAEEHLRRLSAPPDTTVWQEQRSRLDAAALRGDAMAVAALVDRFRQPARQYAEEELLADWAEAEAQGRTEEAGRFLDIARAIGAALVARGGDAMVQDAVQAIEGARGEPERFALLWEGHRIYGLGLRHYKDQDPGSALRDVSRAERLLARAGTPFVHWARMYRASSQYHLMRFDSAAEALEALRTGLGDQRYPSLLGRTYWILASIELLHGRPGDALPLLDQARQLFSRMEEAESLAAIHQHFAIAFGNLGAPDETWQALFAALRALGRVHSIERRFAILDEAGVVCLRHGEPEVALDELLDFQIHHEERSRALANRAAGLPWSPETMREELLAHCVRRRFDPDLSGQPALLLDLSRLEIHPAQGHDRAGPLRPVPACSRLPPA